MCSISGIIERTEKQINSMIEIQKHRAPDGSGHYLDRNIVLGMGRLKIIDLYSDNLCPRVEDDLVLSFNGEIYNHIEIKDKLKLKYSFQTTSDTEVLIKSWKEYGAKALEQFNGMFAFAIYDKKKEKVYLAKDIAREKTFYNCYE